MKKILLYTFIAAASVFTTSCNDYLDCEPITSVSTNVYLYSETDLAAYAAKFYNDSEDEKDDEYGNILPSHGSATYNLGLFQKDNGTDDQTADSPSKLFVKGQYHVGDDDLWHKYFRKIRAANYFIQTVTERYTNREISGNDANIKHYIGEVYFFRAYIYLTALQNLGDFPILTEILPDDYNAIREASKRRPRNEVARFILSDLDKAYEYMLPTAPVSNRLNKDCAALVKSRAALFEATWEKYQATNGNSDVPGTDSNGNQEYVYQDNSESSSTTSEEERKYTPSERITDKQIPAGTINYTNSSISCAFTKIVMVREDEVKAQGLLDGVSWEEYKLANEGQTAIDVDQSFYDMVSKATGFPTDNISIMAYSENMFVDSEGLGISATDIMTIVLIVGILALLVFVVLRSMRGDKAAEQPEELAVEDLLQSQPETELENINTEQMSETRRLIERFVDENPEAAASLLRNWLNEDWG